MWTRPAQADESETRGDPEQAGRVWRTTTSQSPAGQTGNLQAVRRALIEIRRCNLPANVTHRHVHHGEHLYTNAMTFK